MSHATTVLVERSLAASLVKQRTAAVAFLFVIFGTGGVFLVMAGIGSAPSRFYYWLFGGLYIALCLYGGLTILRADLRRQEAKSVALKASLDGMAFSSASLGVGAALAAWFPQLSWLPWLLAAAVAVNATGLWIVQSWCSESADSWAMTADRLRAALVPLKRGSPCIPEPEGCLLSILLFMLVGGVLLAAWVVGDVILPLAARLVWALPRRLMFRAQSAVSRATGIALWSGTTVAWLVLVHQLVGWARSVLAF